MEVLQGNSVCSYLKQAKMPFLFPFFCKIKKRGWNRSCRGRSVDTREKREEMGKGCKRANMVQILHTHVCKWTEKIPVETIFRMREEEKENGRYSSLI
jgi:hypothetical protein